MSIKCSFECLIEYFSEKKYMRPLIHIRKSHILLIENIYSRHSVLSNRSIASLIVFYSFIYINEHVVMISFHTYFFFALPHTQRLMTKPLIKPFRTSTPYPQPRK